MLRLHDPDRPSAAEAADAAQRTGVAVAHLLCTAALLHAPHPDDGGLLLGNWQLSAAAGMLACSAAAAMLSGGSRLRAALLPMLEVPVRRGGWAWLPGFGWRPVDDALRSDVLRRSSLPMVGVALVVLPLLAVEHFFEERIARSAGLSAAAAAASGLVWAAFALEFLVGVRLAEKRLDYCKRHWLDLAIILLPLIAFLRAARLARLATIQKSARVYRLRGVAMKVWKAVILFDLIGRVLRRTPEKQAAYLEERRAELLRDLADIDERLADVRRAA